MFRRRRARSEPAQPTWQDVMPDRSGPDSKPGPFLQLTEIDRWRAVPFDMPPAPDRGTCRQRVRQLVEQLGDAVDEGTGAALDLVIESWVAAWIESVRTEYLDHQTVLALHLGQATQYRRELELQAGHASEELNRLNEAYERCRVELAGHPPLDAGQERPTAVRDDDEEDER
ncbi:hypothetical protein [Amycolatopsis sp. WQ 127309]|uniref:hypothetical protein n=1 Tax=Amycolatopsis sp. WQ 127309 TaxID=2932773 RepID=UPI001FF2AFF3|nr:hypothetical protein [Amycolatopsis sp. WQ 127309]UOZ11336.1 hypothetical protein MUY22_24940 [Amycolatopsis sp. WQ 127309]